MFMKYFQKLKRQRKAIKELYSLTDRELKDLGIARCDIERVVKMANP